MNTPMVLQALSGLGLFLFSLRFLSEALGESLNRMLRPWLNRLLGHPLNCLLAGLSVTALVQASGITTLATMGLLNSYAITLEQGYLILLGSSLGTTLKAWLFTHLVETHAGALLVGVCSLVLLFIHQRRLRDWLEIAMAIGFAFLGLQMMTAALGDLPLNSPWLHYFQTGEQAGLSAHALGVLIGMLLTMMVQSSSTVVFLLLQLASQGGLDFASGTALILGANLGTCFQPLLAAIEYGRNVRRLILSSFLIKAGGVLFTLLLFSLFLRGVDRLLPGIPDQELLLHLAGSHFLFNLCAVIAAWLLMPFILRLIFLIIPGDTPGQDFFLHPVVRKMLQQSPDKARAEVQRQLKILLELTMTACEQIVSYLAQNAPEHNGREKQSTRFEMIQEGIYELLLPLCRQAPTEHQERRLLDQLQACSHLYAHTRTFLNLIQTGMNVHGYQLPVTMQALLPDLQAQYHLLWLKIFQQQSVTEVMLALTTLEQQLAQAFLSLPPARSTQTAYEVWLHHCLAELQALNRLTGDLARRSGV
jgi:phosphate:Na+ symporter